MKRKYLTLEGIRDVVYMEGDNKIIRGHASKEIIEINSNIINVYPSDEKLINNTVTCNLRFVERGLSGAPAKTLNWYVHCTLDQADRNIEMIYEILEEFRTGEESERNSKKQDMIAVSETKQ